MGQKVNPIGFRLGISREWSSVWYSKREYPKYLLEDKKIRDLLLRRFSEAGVGYIHLERSPQIKVILGVARPGVVIGRGGSGLTALRELLQSLVGAKVDVVVEEIRVPDLNARLVAIEVIRAIQRRVPVKRVMNQISERVLSRGAAGVKIIVAGVLAGPSSISRREKVSRGSIPSQTLRARIDFAKETAFMKYGTLGIKVWIYLGEAKF